MSAANSPRGSPSTTTGRDPVANDYADALNEIFELLLSDETLPRRMALHVPEGLSHTGTLFADHDTASVQDDSTLFRTGETLLNECDQVTNKEWRETISQLKCFNSVNYEKFKEEVWCFPNGVIPLKVFRTSNNAPETPMDDDHILSNIFKKFNDERLWRDFDLNECEDHDNERVDREEQNIPGVGKLSSLGVDSKVEMKDIIDPVREELFDLLKQLYDHHCQWSSGRTASRTNANTSVAVTSSPSELDIPTLSCSDDDELDKYMDDNYYSLFEKLTRFFDGLTLYQNVVIRYLCKRNGRLEHVQERDVIEEPKYALLNDVTEEAQAPMLDDVTQAAAPREVALAASAPPNDGAPTKEGQQC